MAASRQYFTDKEINLIITYLEELRDSQPGFFAAVLNQEVTGRFFFEIRADTTHPAKAAFESVDSQLDLTFKNTPAMLAFKKDMGNLMGWLADEKLAGKCASKIQDMLIRYSKEIVADDRWDAIFTGLSDKEKKRVENLITTGIVFKLLAAWGFNKEYIQGYSPKELMQANKIIREISAASIGEVGKKEIAEKQKAQALQTAPQKVEQEQPLTDRQKEQPLLLRFQEKFHSLKTPEEKAKWADKFLDFLLGYHKDDFATPMKPNDENTLLLKLAKEAFANVPKLAPKHKELYTLYQARQGDLQEHEKSQKAKAEKFFGEAIKEDEKGTKSKKGSKAERFFGDALKQGKKDSALEKGDFKHGKK